MIVFLSSVVKDATKLQAGILTGCDQMQFRTAFFTRFTQIFTKF